MSGNLVQAADGAGIVGVLYTRTTNLYYCQLNADQTWQAEMLIGASTAGSIAIDQNGIAHIAYVSSNQIAYSNYQNGIWSDPVFIVSNGGGTCSKPDIAVDTNGKAHITYTDTKGQNGDYTDKADIMYATNTTGSFVKTCLYNGFYELLGGADAYAEYFDKGSKIAVNASGTAFVAAHSYIFNKNMSFTDRTYSIALWSSAGGKGSSATATSDAFDIYDAAAFGSKVALTYRHSTTKFAEITGTTALTLSNVQNASTTSSICSLNIDDNSMVLSGVSSGKLVSQFNQLAHTYNNISVTGTAASVVKYNQSFYSVFTDSSDGIIKATEVVRPLSLVSFSITAQTSPALIDYRNRTIMVEASQGTNLSALIPTFTTSTDVTSVKIGEVEQVSGTTENDFTSPKTYTVSDGTTTAEWTVNIGLEPTKYDISIASLPSLGGTTTGAGTYTEGAAVKISATPNENYRFVNWIEGTDIISTNLEYEFTATANRTLTANFIKQYTLTINKLGNGSIEVNGNSYSTPMMLDESQAIEIKAIPQSGWVFDAWSGDYIGTNSPTTITMDADKTIVAEFLFTTGLVSQNKKNNDLPFIQTPNSIKLITNEYVTVQLDGLTGQHILKTTNSNIDISMLRNGLYILTLTKTNGESQSYKIVKR
ncbi:MAG: hypothetical protein JXR39_08985 [Marinilabiliaceae bacterium]|nr:hypothetical protein [Marinilabiliaceae bacterium]